MRVLVALALVGLLGGGAEAASFNCARASQPDEIAICSNPTLNRQDEQLNRLYNDVLSCLGMGSAGAERDFQRTWLDRRSGCGADGACIARLYQQRIDALAPRAARARAFRRVDECPNAI